MHYTGKKYRFRFGVIVGSYLAITVCCLKTVHAQSGPVTIEVNAEKTVGRMDPIWAYFGYDEPNYTYMKDGRKLLTQLSDLSRGPVYVRAHNLLNTDEGPRADLKWGSTNAYTEDSLGNPIYDWSVIDRIFDTYVERGMKPLVEIGFMPKALSTNPEPYRHNWEPGKPYGEVYTGWAYPPKDYEKWAELVYRWVKHSVDRYGKHEVESWWWEVWNEPNIGYWQGTKEEYFKLYDYSADAVKRALPTARIGGPHTTGPRWKPAEDFLRDFLDHCLKGTNYATGERGAPLDFVAFHAKGSPRVVDGDVQMRMDGQVWDVALGFQIVASYPAFKELPIIIGEADPEGCAACSMRLYPRNTYRNGTMYSSYTVASFAKFYELADKYDVNFEGALSWSFEFENQRWFDGFRSLATNGIGKPVLNVFRMFGMMGGNRVEVHSSSAVSAEEVIENGIRTYPEVNAMATLEGNKLSVLVWNYHDDSQRAPPSDISLKLENIPAERTLLKHYRVDDDFSNSYQVWMEMGAPQQTTGEQYAALQQASELAMITSPQWISVTEGTADLPFSLPRHGVSLLQFTW